MILTCPECATSYSVDDAKIGADGRIVRCAGCGARWTARLGDDAETLTTPIEPIVERPKPAPEPVPEIRVGRGAKPADALPQAFRARAKAKKEVKAAAETAAVWAGMAAMLTVLLLMAYVFRVDVVKLWPKTASAYASVGVPVNPLGLQFEELGARPALKDGRAALIVSGKIRNTKDHPVESPPLQIQLLDKAGRSLEVKHVDPENPLIPPGQARAFSISLYDPPPAAEDAKVAFALDRKVAHKPASPVAKTAEAGNLRGAIEVAPPAPPAAPVDAKPLPADSAHAIAPHG
jgi:predicted Zn finger-like uncharacterized protein